MDFRGRREASICTKNESCGSNPSNTVLTGLNRMAGCGRFWEAGEATGQNSPTFSGNGFPNNAKETERPNAKELSVEELNLPSVVLCCELCHVHCNHCVYILVH